MLTGGTAYALDGSNTVFSDDIVNGEVKEADIGSGAVREGEIAQGAVTSDEVRNDNLTGGDVLDNSLGAADLGSNSVNTSELANGAVTPVKFGTVPAARAFATVNQTIPFSTGTFLNLNAEDFDTANLHQRKTNNSRLVAPVAGLYQVSAAVRWDSNTTGSRLLQINAGGSASRVLVADLRERSSSAIQSASTLARLEAGDHVQILVLQDGTGTVQTVAATGLGSPDPVLAMHWVAHSSP